MMKYYIEMLDTEGNTWFGDGFDTKEDAEHEARLQEEENGWKLVKVDTYLEWR